MKNLFNILVLILTVILIQSCKEDKPTPPIITTTAVSAISYTTATSGGNATDEGGAPIVSKGVCWNISAEPTVDNSKTTESIGLGTFASNLTQLTPNTMYYVRAYATNSAGTGYGNQVTFTTLTVEVPVLTTTEVTEITQTTAVSGGNVTDDKGGSVTARGVCWSTSQNPTTADSKTTDGTGTGSFVSNLTGLQAGTLYYVRAYSTNNVGTAYGNEISFTTLPATTPILITTDITYITQNTATCGGTITSDGAASITARGICWSTSQNPTISDSKTYDDSGTGTYTSSLTGLIGNTTYFVRAYATNIVGTEYGNQVSFKTSPLMPTLTTFEVSSITATSCNSGGNISSDGGAPVTTRGVCWSTSASPTIADNKTTDGTGTGAFTSLLEGLTIETNYYLRAYATNSAGTAYGNEISFTSSPVLVTGITLDLTTTNITKGSTKQLTASILPSNATNKNVIWSSSNNSIATVSSSGLVTAVTLGTATIKVTTEDGSFEATCSVDVVPYFSEIGKAYLAVDGLTVTLNSLVITETTGSYKYSINYTLANNTPDQAIDEGAFKMYYANISGGLPQYGSFGTLFPGGMITRSYTFEELKSDPFGTLEYHHDNFFSNTPIEGSLKWEVDITNPATLPTLTTTYITAITQTTASSGGNITDDGGETVTARGVCWKTEYDTEPTIANSKTTDGTGIGAFTSSITGLTPYTTYYLRAYATNSAGTKYGSKMQFFTTETTAIIFNSNLTYEVISDIEGNVYNTITIGTQTWMAENLRTTKYNDGTVIPLVPDNPAWENLITSGYCWYSNDDLTYKNIYGALYNWYTANTGKLCPTGWHVPTNSEWTIMKDFLGGWDVAGGKLKEIGTTHWLSPNTGATNETGFTALPGGKREGMMFYWIGAIGSWWTVTESDAARAFIWYLQTSSIGVNNTAAGNKNSGYSVRCLKD